MKLLYMTFIGINGFGRIGKSIFIQLLGHKTLKIKAINAPNFSLDNLVSYLENDSTHHYPKNWSIKIINETTFSINDQVIHLLNNRDASLLNWSYYNIHYVIDSTGVYLTQDKCKKHNVDYVIMCAPPKDNSPQFVYNVNHDKYNGENIISNASCTTNCITPVLGFLEKKYGVKKANFTTIHATTASQNTIDTNHFNNRTCRSIINNIIPHNTGASKSIKALLPSLDGKILGTSLRIPVSNVSIVDLNVTLEKEIKLKDLIFDIKNSGYIKVNNQNLVSSDFNTTKIPSIIDTNASMQLDKNEFKLMIWYDNEWSYSAQVIKLAEHISQYNIQKNNHNHPFFIENYNYKNKKVILRVDWNIPYNKETYNINDDFRIVSSLKSLNYILNQKPKYIVVITHLGRPKGNGFEDKLSLKHFLKQIQSYFQDSIYFLKDGVHQKSLEILEKNEHTIYLCENIRFHEEETQFAKKDLNNNALNALFNQMGNIYVNDAFGCLHRKHLSICGFKNSNKAFGYLIQKEIQCLDLIQKNINHERILAIIGGGKMDDKLALLEQLSKKIDGIYISGGNINSILKNKEYKNYIDFIQNNKAKIYEMHDGLASEDLNNKCTYYQSFELPETKYFFDIGMQSIIELNSIIQNYDIIFWNGTLGVVEHELYQYGTRTLIELLKKSGKKIVIGGGDTACFVNKFEHNFYYVSTGGGASIDYISNGSLIGFDYYN